MANVVATIQAEQDRVIRADLPGVLVVQGGPGTGKTVAALHRAAYLLYTHRRVLERRGVLVIGPNATFLRYISQVLPSLGETDVVLHTLGDLFPGVHATDTRDPAAVIKGDERMVRVLQQAVRDRQAVPKRDIIVNAEGVDVPLAREAILRARDRARSTRKPHNVARKLFVTELLTDLARAEARVLNRPLDAEDLPDARARLWDCEGVNAALNALWPLLTPEMLLAALLRSPQAIRSAAGSVLDHSERERLTRSDHPSRWTVADVPLLDEAAELLGVDDSAQQAARRAAERARRAEQEYAQEVLDSAIVGGMEFSMTVSQLGMLDAARLSDWNSGGGVAFSTAERAAADRTWAYGHVIVDEAQELSPMAWRMVLRRNPARSMTVVGDVAQTGSPAGATSWKDMLTPLVGHRWREERLTVNYRTPKEIMTVAADVLASVSASRGAAGLGPLRGRSPGGGPGRRRWPGRLRGRPRSRGPSRDRRRGRGPPSDHRAGRADRLARAGHARGRPRRPARVARLPGRAAYRLAGQGPRIRPGDRRGPVRHPRPVAERRPRPVRGSHPRDAPAHRRLRGRIACPAAVARRLTPRPAARRAAARAA